jgi:hypothetical protein
MFRVLRARSGVRSISATTATATCRRSMNCEDQVPRIDPTVRAGRAARARQRQLLRLRPNEEDSPYMLLARPF